MNLSEFPHSEISGSMLICSSPKLIAAYHVFHRLPSAKAFALRPCSLDHIKLISFEIGLYPLDSLLPTKIMLPFLLKLQYFLKRTYYNLCFAVIIQFSRYVFEFPFQGPQNRTISNQPVSITCSRNKSSSMFCSCLTLRKEVIQPQVLLRLPCYDFTPITSFTFGGVLLTVRLPTSGPPALMV